MQKSRNLHKVSSPGIERVVIFLGFTLGFGLKALRASCLRCLQSGQNEGGRKLFHQTILPLPECSESSESRQSHSEKSDCNNSNLFRLASIIIACQYLSRGRFEIIYFTIKKNQLTTVTMADNPYTNRGRSEEVWTVLLAYGFRRSTNSRGKHYFQGKAPSPCFERIVRDAMKTASWKVIQSVALHMISGQAGCWRMRICPTRMT